MRQIILDTETTGLDPKQGHRIIEIGCIELVNRRFSGNNFQTYINPEREIDAGALQVHGLTNQFLSDKPLFADIHTQFLNYITGAEIIIHNAPFDLGFLHAEFLRLNPKNPNLQKYCKITDTLELARKLHPGQRNNLDALCKRYAVDNKERDLHGALLDAKLLAYVYLAMTSGQESMFEQLELNSRRTEESAAHSPQKNWQLPVIKANETENKAHQDYLKSLQTSAEKVIWEE